MQYQSHCRFHQMENHVQVLPEKKYHYYHEHEYEHEYQYEHEHESMRMSTSVIMTTSICRLSQ